MALKQTTPPALEPITLADAKAFLRVDGDAEDAYISSLITTSRLHVEAALDLALIAQSFELSCAASQRCIVIGTHPVTAITAVRVSNRSGETSDVSLDELDINLCDRPAVLTLPAHLAHSGDVAHVHFEAGFGATPDDVPAPICQALRLLIAHWFETREPITNASPAHRIPDTVSELLQPFRQVRV